MVQLVHDILLANLLPCHSLTELQKSQLRILKKHSTINLGNLGPMEIFVKIEISQRLSG